MTGLGLRKRSGTTSNDRSLSSLVFLLGLCRTFYHHLTVFVSWPGYYSCPNKLHLPHLSSVKLSPPNPQLLLWTQAGPRSAEGGLILLFLPPPPTSVPDTVCVPSGDGQLLTLLQTSRSPAEASRYPTYTLPKRSHASLESPRQFLESPGQKTAHLA